VKKNKHGNVRIVRLLDSFYDKTSAKKYCKKHDAKQDGEKLPIIYGHVENIKYLASDARKCYVVEERVFPSDGKYMVAYVSKRDDDDYQDEIVYLTGTLGEAEDFVNGGLENDNMDNSNVVVYQGCCKDVYKYYKPGSYVVIEHVSPRT
jgi:hypothetical protein